MALRSTGLRLPVRVDERKRLTVQNLLLTTLLTLAPLSKPTHQYSKSAEMFNYYPNVNERFKSVQST